MKSSILLALSLCVGLSLASPARAGGTIDATQYLPVGAFNAWEMIDKAIWAEGAGTKDEAQLVDVGKIFVVDGVPSYNIRTPFFQDVGDIILQFGVDSGVLYLYAVRVVDGEALIGTDDLSVPTMFFDDPVPVGDTTTDLDVDFAVTPVTAKIDVSIDVGPDDISGTVFVAGTITARWNSVPLPIVTPLGTLGDDEELAELVLTADLTYSSTNPDIDDELQGVETHKSVSGITGPGIGFVQIDGKGSQQKIVNRVILPGTLVSGAGQADEFPPVPAGDLQSFTFAIPDVVTLDGTQNPVADGGITDGVVTLDDVKLVHYLGGKLELTAQASAGGAGPVDLFMKGTAKPNAKTGGLKVKLAGKTKKLDAFAKLVKFSVNQELPAPFDGSVPLDIAYSAGKDPETLLPIEGTLQLPVTPFVGANVDVTVNLPVDVPKVKKGFLVINTAKRPMGAEGVLTLDETGNGGTKTFPVILKEKVTIKEGLPSVRTYKMVHTGTLNKVFGLAATSTSPADFVLTKLSGKLVGVKIAPLLTDVQVTSQ